MIIFSEGELEIGSIVRTELNGECISGMLLCSSEMGLTTIDLFNDIFIVLGSQHNFILRSSNT